MEYIFSRQHLSWLDDIMPEKDRKEEEEKLKWKQDQDGSDSEDVSMTEFGGEEANFEGLNWVEITHLSSMYGNVGSKKRNGNRLFSESGWPSCLVTGLESLMNSSSYL